LVGLREVDPQSQQSSRPPFLSAKTPGRSTSSPAAAVDPSNPRRRRGNGVRNPGSGGLCNSMCLGVSRQGCIGHFCTAISSLRLSSPDFSSSRLHSPPHPHSRSGPYTGLMKECSCTVNLQLTLNNTERSSERSIQQQCKG
jgi:hypothetical protein